MCNHLRRCFLFYLALAALTVATYAHVSGFELLNCDDDRYVTNNPHIKTGINARSIRWAFTEPYDANWMPLVWISYMLDHQTGGAEPHLLYDQPSEHPAPYHRTNLIIHVLNTLLLFGLLNAMTGSRWPSALVAALFAVHPLHVQSVAWVAERKDVLSTFFMLLTILAYWRYCSKPGVARYAAVALAYALALMSKSMAVTMPALLLLLDYWPLERWRRVRTRTLLLEKLPLFLMAAVVGTITILQQHNAGAVGTLTAYPLAVRLGNALVSCTGYLQKMLYPASLAFYYPHPGTSLAVWQIAGSALLFALIWAWCVRAAGKRPYLLVGWLWYLVTLLPVIGLVQVGDQGMADRYTYVPLIGIFLAMAWGLWELVSRVSKAQVRTARRLAALFACAAVLALAVRAWFEVRYWRNDVTIFSRAIEVSPRAIMPRYNLATALTMEGDLEGAVEHYRAALSVDPKEVTAHMQLAWTLDRLGHSEQATEHYEQALRLRPQKWHEANNLAMVLAADPDPSRHNPRQAVVHAQRACKETNYARPDLLDTLAVAYAADGRFGEAIRVADRALAMAEDERDSELAEEIEQKLRLYRSGHAYVLPSGQKW